MKRFLFFIINLFLLTGFCNSQSCDTVSIKKLYQEANITVSKDVNKSYALAFNRIFSCKRMPLFQTSLRSGNLFMQSVLSKRSRRLRDKTFTSHIEKITSKYFHIL
jgi:hypothetical protein